MTQANEQTDKHTRNLRLLGTSLQPSQECLQEISEIYLIQNWSYLNLCNFSKETSQITD